MTVRPLFVALPLLAVMSLAAVAASVSPARAEGVAPPAEEPRRPGQVARERVDEVLRSLEKFVADLPRYGLPQIAENGDIVIPRKNPPAGANDKAESSVADI